MKWLLFNIAGSQIMHHKLATLMLGGFFDADAPSVVYIKNLNFDTTEANHFVLR